MKKVIVWTWDSNAGDFSAGGFDGAEVDITPENFAREKRQTKCRGRSRGEHLVELIDDQKEVMLDSYQTDAALR